MATMPVMTPGKGKNSVNGERTKQTNVNRTACTRQSGTLGTEAPGPAARPAESPAPPVSRGGTSTLGVCIFRSSAPQLTQYAVPSSFRVPQLEQNIGFAPPCKRSKNVDGRCQSIMRDSDPRTARKSDAPGGAPPEEFP